MCNTKTPSLTKETRHFAAYIAMVVRNAMEDFHGEHLTDEQIWEVAPNCRTLQMLSFAARLSSGGVSYGREFESQEASWSSCVQ